MTKAYNLTKNCSAKELKLTKITVSEPKGNEVQIKNHYVAINHMDVHHRNGTYAMSSFPQIIGIAGAGEIVKVGPKVENKNIGDKVVYGTNFIGSYAEMVNIDERLLLTVDKEVTMKVMVGVIVPGLLSYSLLHKVYKVKKDDIALVNGITGSVAHILSQWLNSEGVNVIGSVTRKEDVIKGKSMGCRICFCNNDADYVKNISKYTKKNGVNVVYDCYGDKYFKINCKLLTYFGMLINYGDTTGIIKENFDASALWQKSLYFSKVNVSLWQGYHMERVLSSDILLKKIKSKEIIPKISETNFAKIPEIHEMIENNAIDGIVVAKL